MRRLKLLYLIHLFIIIAFVIPTYGADVAKIAILDSRKVLNESLLGKKMKKELEKINAKYTADLEARSKEIQNLQKELEKLASLQETSSTADREEFDKKKRELEITIYDFKRLEKKYQDKFIEEEGERYKYTTDFIQKIVDEIGKKEGYLLIKNQRGCFYSPEYIDITDKVLKLVDSRFKRDELKEKKAKQ